MTGPRMTPATENRNALASVVDQVRVGDEVGTGVFEQLVIGPHEPSGFVDLVDGAAPR